MNFNARLRNVKCLSLLALILCLFASSAWAHEISFSHGKVQLGDPIQISLELPLRDLAVALGVDEQTLSKPGAILEQQSKIERLIAKRFVASSAGSILTHQDFKLEPAIIGKNLHVSFSLAASSQGSVPSLKVNLFPEKNLHKTFLDVYRAGTLERQVILDSTQTRLELQANTRQSIPEVVWNFLLEGVHHIFIGPDHILFVIGLLLLGGTLGQLLKIVSAFTISHSVTLALATLHIFNPPSSLIEPAIAASIVFVGVHSLVSKNTRDLRVCFALAFGLIHGFGFANALAEMQLPQDALVWSLFAFNAGIEVGQACIVLAVAPVLALMRSRLEPVLAGRIIDAGSLAVIAAGAFWFIERVSGA
jgi:hydrogenase/urease accessory protein HupE